MTTIIKAFPLEIFSIIQYYLEEEEYQQLMSCNNTHYLRFVKYETIQYIMTIKIFDCLRKDQLELKFQQFQVLISNVKNKSKQIGLQLYQATCDSLLQYSPYFQKINYLYVSFDDKSRPTNFDFSIFNDIHTVMLDSFNAFKYISSGFENVRELTFTCSSILHELNLNLSTLERLCINYCPFLELNAQLLRCPRIGLHDISQEIHLDENFPYQSITIKGHHVSTFNVNLFNRCNFSHLESLEIDNFTFPDDSLSPSLSHVQRLILKAPSSSNRPHFPSTFYGTYLDLTGFDLSQWTSIDCLPNIKTIILKGCNGLDPELRAFASSIKRITLSHLINCMITTLPTLPVCVFIRLYGLSSIQTIHIQPNLKKLEIYYCRQFYYLDVLPDQIFREVIIEGCDQFTSSFHQFVNSYSFVIRLNRLDFNIIDLDQSFLSVNQRSINIEAFSLDIEDTTVGNVRNIGNLQSLWMSFPQRILLENIHDIEHLILHKCSKMETLHGISNIRLLQLSEMESLISFHGLQNIHMIMIAGCRKENMKLNGLKECEIVYLKDCKWLEYQALAYANDHKTYAEVFQHVKKFYLVDDDSSGWCLPSELPTKTVTRLW